MLYETKIRQGNYGFYVSVDEEKEFQIQFIEYPHKDFPNWPNFDKTSTVIWQRHGRMKITFKEYAAVLRQILHSLEETIIQLSIRSVLDRRRWLQKFCESVAANR